MLTILNDDSFYYYILGLVLLLCSTSSTTSILVLFVALLDLGRTLLLGYNLSLRHVFLATSLNQFVVSRILPFLSYFAFLMHPFSLFSDNKIAVSLLL